MKMVWLKILAIYLVVTRLRVVHFMSYDDAVNMKPAPLPDIGGWFGFRRKNTWMDYEEILYPHGVIYARALRNFCIKNNVRMTGHDHQESRHGIPVFSNGRVFSATYRAWGDFMAATWCGPDKIEHSYISFYM